METIIAVSACETIEETLAFAIEQMKQRGMKKIIFFYAGSKYIIEKQDLIKSK